MTGCGTLTSGTYLVSPLVTGSPLVTASPLIRAGCTMCYGWALITLVYHYTFGHDTVYVIRIRYT